MFADGKSRTYHPDDNCPSGFLALKYVCLGNPKYLYLGNPKYVYLGNPKYVYLGYSMEIINTHILWISYVKL